MTPAKRRQAPYETILSISVKRGLFFPKLSFTKKARIEETMFVFVRTTCTPTGVFTLERDKPSAEGRMAGGPPKVCILAAEIYSRALSEGASNRNNKSRARTRERECVTHFANCHIYQCVCVCECECARRRRRRWKLFGEGKSIM